MNDVHPGFSMFFQNLDSGIRMYLHQRIRFSYLLSNAIILSFSAPANETSNLPIEF